MIKRDSVFMIWNVTKIQYSSPRDQYSLKETSIQREREISGGGTFLSIHDSVFFVTEISTHVWAEIRERSVNVVRWL